MNKNKQKISLPEIFKKNKRNSKPRWQGIHDITYFKKSNRINTAYSLLREGNTITDSQDISKHFNNFFSSIGQDLQKHIAPTKKHFSDYLKAPNTYILYFAHKT